MQRIQVEDRAPGEPGNDVFVGLPLDHPERFVTCTRQEGSTVDPQCAQVFVTANLLIRVSDRRPLLPRWRDIEQATSAFLRDHEVLQGLPPETWTAWIPLQIDGKAKDAASGSASRRRTS